MTDGFAVSAELQPAVLTELVPELCRQTDFVLLKTGMRLGSREKQVFVCFMEPDFDN